MVTLIIILFVICFGSILAVVFVSERYFKARQKKHLISILKQAEDAPTARKASNENLLKPAVNDWLNTLISKFSFVEKLDLMMEQSGRGSSGGGLLVWCLVAGGIGFVLGQRFSFILTREVTAACFAVLAAPLPFYNMLRMRKKRFSQFEQQLPEALDFISRSMRAGHGFSIALEMLAADSPEPLGPAFSTIANYMQLGGALDSSLSALCDLFPLIDVRFFVSCVILQQETGGNLGEILSKLATIIRERFRLKGQVKAASAHGRITGLVLVLMPIAVAAFMMVTSPQYLVEMSEDHVGRIMIYGAVMGQIIGYFVIQKIINIKV